MRGTRPTMRDVAASAGVSLKTVSRVVNREAGVRAETAQRVQAAIAALDFAPNELASSLRNGRAGAIGLVIEDLANPFYSEIGRAVEDAARERGHLLLIGSCAEDPARERELVTRFLRRAVDALLIVPAGDDHGYLRRELHASDGRPLVFLDRPPTGIDVDTVVGDSRAGARSAVEHLLAHGHTRIAVIADHEGVWTARERLAGFADALAGAGRAPDPALVRAGVRSAAAAQATVAELLALPADRRPTALFTANNRISVGAVRALGEAGARLAVVGFDDVELGAMLAVPLTVVRHSSAQIGRLGIEAAYARLAGDDGAPRRWVVPTELVARGSGEVRP
jgi:LacI family transcriptional regulator